MMSAPDRPSGDMGIDWEHARAFLLAAVRHRIDRESPETHEDLAQNALVRLIRAVRREPARNLDALMNTIAGHVVVDHLRGRRRWRLLMDPLDAQAEQVAAPPERHGDPFERLRFVIVEYFVTEDARCVELARAFFAEVSWKELAARLGVAHVTLIKRWSRCVARLRAAASDEVNPLLEWCRE